MRQSAQRTVADQIAAPQSVLDRGMNPAQISALLENRAKLAPMGPFGSLNGSALLSCLLSRG